MPGNDPQKAPSGFDSLVGAIVVAPGSSQTSPSCPFCHDDGKIWGYLLGHHRFGWMVCMRCSAGAALLPTVEADVEKMIAWELEQERNGAND